MACIKLCDSVVGKRETDSKGQRRRRHPRQLNKLIANSVRLTNDLLIKNLPSNIQREYKYALKETTFIDKRKSIDLQAH